MTHSEEESQRRIGHPEGFSAGPTHSPRVPGPLEIMVRTSAVWGLIAAAIVFGVFCVLPLLHPVSGAAGAFAATFFIVLGQRASGRRGR
jgi:hypothetical protein